MTNFAYEVVLIEFQMYPTNKMTHLQVRYLPLTLHFQS